MSSINEENRSTAQGPVESELADVGKPNNGFTGQRDGLAVSSEFHEEIPLETELSQQQKHTLEGNLMDSVVSEHIESVRTHNTEDSVQIEETHQHRVAESTLEEPATKKFKGDSLSVASVRTLDDQSHDVQQQISVVSVSDQATVSFSDETALKEEARLQQTHIQGYHKEQVVSNSNPSTESLEIGAEPIRKTNNNSLDEELDVATSEGILENDKHSAEIIDSPLAARNIPATPGPEVTSLNTRNREGGMGSTSAIQLSQASKDSIIVKSTEDSNLGHNLSKDTLPNSNIFSSPTRNAHGVDSYTNGGGSDTTPLEQDAYSSSGNISRFPGISNHHTSGTGSEGSHMNNSVQSASINSRGYADYSVNNSVNNLAQPDTNQFGTQYSSGSHATTRMPGQPASAAQVRSHPLGTVNTPANMNTIIRGRMPNQTIPRTNRLVLVYDKPRYYHMIMQLNELRSSPHESVTVVELSEISRLVGDPQITKASFDQLNICIEYNEEFKNNLKRFMDFIEDNESAFQKFAEVNYHIQFAPDKKWKDDYSPSEKAEYKRFIEVLSKAFGDKIRHCSIINKYDMDTVYITERHELTKLGQEIQDDIIHWKNLRVLDYGESSIRFLPGVKLPDSLEVLNIGGGYALETLTGFKMPLRLKTLLASQNAIHTIDNVTFPLTLERLELSDNKIYFLNQVDFPPRLEHLDVSQNRIESLRGVSFPSTLRSLNLGFNPIESIKSVKFPEGLLYLDVSNIPNESMTGVKFPESLQVLNLQASMTNTRGLKLPSTLSKLIMADNGVNSINPLKLPNSIEVLYLNNNNIKTLNKVQFPTNLRELYLGDNLITTLKSVVFPPTLEVLDIEMDPDYDEQEKHLTTLKDVTFPSNLKVLKLGYHSMRIIEGIDFPLSLISLSLSYNDIRSIKNVRFGNSLKTLDISGNQELTNIDQFIIPESVSELRVPPELIPHLPAYIVERANKKELLLKKSMQY